MADKILIFRRGSLGDGVVSIPALRVIAERYPEAERRILTNGPVTGTAAPIQSLLGPTGLVDDFITATPGIRNPAALYRLGRSIASWGPELLIYLSEPSMRMALLREVAFFRFCGIQRFVALPFGRNLRRYRPLNDGLWESESTRLLRAIGWEGEAERLWTHSFHEKERMKAETCLSGWSGSNIFLAFSIGAKMEDKDWGNDNWRWVLDQLTSAYPELGIVMIGAGDEMGRSDELAEIWRGPSLNLCGRIEPRISAVIMGGARLFLGHDSGPMHLAALAGCRCVAVFSARAKPGVWFPHGKNHKILYPWELASTSPDTAGFKTAGLSIQSINPMDVLSACHEILKGEGFGDNP